MDFKKITYRNKKYFDYKNNKKISYRAINYDRNIILMISTECLLTRSLISSIYHNFTCQNDYNKNIKELSNNEQYVITKNEFNRLYKEFKNQFKSNCFI